MEKDLKSIVMSTGLVSKECYEEAGFGEGLTRTPEEWKGLLLGVPDEA